MGKAFSQALRASGLPLSRRSEQVMWPYLGPVREATKRAASGRPEDLGAFVRSSQHGVVCRSAPFV